MLRLHFSANEMGFEAQGIRIDRELERVVAAPLPQIFVDVPAKEYEKLAPLAAKMFVAATKRQQLFLYPEKFAHATEEEWRAHFMDERRAGRVEGEALDFRIICPLAEQAQEGAWRTSSLDTVVDYLLAQL